MKHDISKNLIISSPADITRKGVWDELGSDYLAVAPAFRFRRSREFPVLAVNELMDNIEDEEADLWHRKNSILAVRDFLETQWIPNEANASSSNFALFAKEYVNEYTQPPVENDATNPKLYYSTIEGDEVVDKPVPTGAVIAHAKNPDTGTVHYFWLETFGDVDLQASQFANDAEPYETTWNTLVDSIKHVRPSSAPMVADHHFLDLSVGALMQRYPYLYNQLEVANKLKATLNDKIPKETDYGLVRAFSQELQGLNLRAAQLKRSMSSLVGYAASKGYVLVEDAQVFKDTYKEKVSDTLKVAPGDLITVKRFVTRWVEKVETQHIRKRLFRHSKRWTTTHMVNHSAQDVDYIKVQNADSMVTNYINAELTNFNAITLKNVEGGLQAHDGRSLESIMSQCEMDQGYRAKCVLLMPVYNQNLFGDDVITGYHVIKHPTRGRRIVSMPQFFFEENISYRLRWLGLELGELMSSINLLPGEVREISIKTSRTSLHEDEIKTTQGFETDGTTSFDTVSSIENEFQKENTSEKTKSWSVQASGSYGGFSAGGSTSGSSKKTARQFAKSLNKLTTQAISKMRKQSRSEVVARALSREEMEASSSSSGQISNPNVGRTLNVNYFGINNVFASSTYIDDIAFTYISPFELIDGTDIREVRSFSKEQLPEFLDSVTEDLTEMLIRGLRFENTALSRSDRRAKAEALAATFIETLKGDLVAAFMDYSTPNADAHSENCAVQAFDVSTDGKDKVRAIDPKKDKNLETLIRQLTATGKAIEPDIIISPSAAFYADATTGHSEGLESYAVEMRKLEVEKQMADVVSTMTSSPQSAKSDRKTHHNVSHTLTDAGTLMIQVGGAISPGSWLYRIGAVVVAALPILDGTSSYEITLTPTQVADFKNNVLPGSLVRNA